MQLLHAVTGSMAFCTPQGGKWSRDEAEGAISPQGLSCIPVYHVSFPQGLNQIHSILQCYTDQWLLTTTLLSGKVLGMLLLIVISLASVLSKILCRKRIDIVRVGFGPLTFALLAQMSYL